MSNKSVKKLSKTYSINEEIVKLVLEYKLRYSVDTLEGYYVTVMNGNHREYIIKTGDIIKRITNNKVNVEHFVIDTSNTLSPNGLDTSDYNQFVKANGLMTVILLWDNSMNVIITDRANVT